MRPNLPGEEPEEREVVPLEHIANDAGDDSATYGSRSAEFLGNDPGRSHRDRRSHQAPGRQRRIRRGTGTGYDTARSQRPPEVERPVPDPSNLRSSAFSAFICG